MSEYQEKSMRRSVEERTGFKIEAEQLVDFIHGYSRDIKIDHSTVLGYFDALTEQDKNDISMMIKFK